MGAIYRVGLVVFALFSIGLADVYAEERKALVGGRLIDGFGHAPIRNSVTMPAHAGTSTSTPHTAPRTGRIGVG